MASVEAVIVGGECVGISAFLHLSALGRSDVVLVEADIIATGSTIKAARGIRMQHGTR